jgi:hypothetical protein
MDGRAISWMLFTPAIGLWWASLFQPALKQPAGAGIFQYSGLNCLLLGWIGFLGRPLWALPWAANVLYWMTVGSGIFRRRPSRETLVLSLVAIPLALVTLANRTIEMDGAGNKTAIVPGLGFYLWLGSMVMAAAALAATEKGL